jgi:hypothetical protein
LKLTFTGGGPMDGEHFVSEHPAQAWFAVEGGGWYQLWETVASEDPTGDWPTAVYEWVPGSDVISRLYEPAGREHGRAAGDGRVIHRRAAKGHARRD